MKDVNKCTKETLQLMEEANQVLHDVDKLLAFVEEAYIPDVPPEEEPDKSLLSSAKDFVASLLRRG
jgi:hypothetical protein